MQMTYLPIFVIIFAIQRHYPSQSLVSNGICAKSSGERRRKYLSQRKRRWNRSPLDIYIKKRKTEIS